MAPSLLYTTPAQKHSGGGAWTPSSSSSLKLWFDMNNAGQMTFSTSNNIATITDLSPSGIVATWYAGAGARATQVSNQLNGLSVFHTNSSSAYSFSAAPYDNATSNGWSKYFIMKINASATHAWFYNFTDSNNTSHSPANTSYCANDTTNGLAFLQQNGIGRCHAPQITDTASFHVVEFHYNGSGNSSVSNYAIKVDHTSQTLSTGAADWVNQNGMTGYDGSTDTGNWLKCDLAAVIDFSPTILGTGTATSMTSWISSTYGL